MKIDVLEIFKMGVDYGQLIMEQERAGEEWADAFQGFVIDKKYSMPSQQSPTRRVYSEKWFEAKKKSLDDFLEIYVQVKTKPRQLQIEFI